MFWCGLGHNLKFRNSHDSSSCSLKEEKKNAKLMVQSLQVASLQEVDWFLHSASSFRTQNFNAWRPEYILKYPWKISDGKAGLLESLTSLKGSEEFLFWRRWDCSEGKHRENKKDAKFRTLPFTMNWLLQISIHPFFTGSSIISSYFPGGGWGLVWRLFFFFNLLFNCVNIRRV